MRFTLPYPPSLNNYYATYKGRRLLSRQGRQYAKDVAAAVMEQAPGATRGKQRLHVVIRFAPPDKRVRDCDNILKPIFDGLKKAGLYDDDGQIDAHEVYRHLPDKDCPRVVVYLLPAANLEKLKW